jgi:hypothetical protein
MLGYRPVKTLSRAEAVVAGAAHLAELVSVMEEKLKNRPLSVRLQWARISANLGKSVYTVLSDSCGYSSSQLLEI